MLKYFEIPYKEYNGIVRKVYKPEDVTTIVNTYAKENNLEVINVSTYENKGIYVVFKEKTI